MKSRNIIIAGALILIIAAGLYVYYFVYNKSHIDYESATPAYIMQAQELYDAFIDDEASAQQTYTGQIIEITGFVSDVEHADSLVVVLFYFGEGLFGDEGVRAVMLEEYQDIAIELKKGEETTIKGYCTGFTGTDVVLTHSSLP